MAVDGWRAYYTGGREFGSDGHDWADLPDDGVLLLKLYYDEFTADGSVRYTKRLSGDDHYFHAPGTDLFGCNNDPIEDIHDRYPGVVVKRGKWTTREEMVAVRERAKHDPCP